MRRCAVVTRRSLVSRSLAPLALLLACTAAPATTTPNDAPPPASASAVESGPPRTRTPSGLELLVVRGGGPVEPPTLDDRVVLHYDARDPSGAWWRKSEPDAPQTFAMRDLPAGWSEALATMGAGDRATLWVPAALGSLDPARGPLGPQRVEVALVDVLRGPAPRDLPIATPPADAIRTASGVAYVRIVEGKGVVHPTPDHTITAHYTGWTTDGKKFDSSHDRHEPIQFRTTQVIPGWSEALQLMVVGDKTRFWIPQELAYAGRPGRPHGMLVFDIELVAVE